MPSCSVHHCVLFLLTLTLTTDPGSAAVFPIYAKLHQPVTLPCEAQCSPRKAKWSLDSQRDDVFARCNQTSCTSVQQGYEMSHDQYKRGDLSLTITNPDYSMRETYTCECDLSDYVTVRLRISTVSSAVQMFPGEDLKLDLTVPESVEVIYRRSDSADGVQICNVTNRTLECNTEYTPRTSLNNSELTLRNMKRSESGTYTIRNLDYKEDIRVYAVSVSGLTSGETAGIVIPVLLLLAGVIAGVWMYMRREANRRETERKQKRIEVMRDKEAVDDLIDQALLKPPVEMMAALQQVEEKIKDLEQKYREDREYKELITLFCNSKRSEMDLCRKLFEPQVGELQSVTEEVKSRMKAVYDLINETLHSAAVGDAELQQVEKKIKDLEKYSTGGSVFTDPVSLFRSSKTSYLMSYRDVFLTGNTTLSSVTEKVKTEMKAVDGLIKEAELKPPEEKGEMIQEVLQKINDVKLKYSRTGAYYMNVSLLCGNKREDLEFCRKFYGTQKGSQDPQTEEVKREMEVVDDLIKQAHLKPPREQEEELRKAKDKIIHVLGKYPNLNQIYEFKREEPDLWRKVYGFQMGSQQHETEEEINKIKEVDELIRKVKHNPAGEVKKVLEQVEKMIDELDYTKQYSESNNRAERFWKEKRKDLELCSRLGLLALGFTLSDTDQLMEKVVKMLNYLSLRADQNRTISPDLLLHMYTTMSLSLKWIDDCCFNQRETLNNFKRQPSRGETDNQMICYMERHLMGLQQWCMGKECELEKYREKLRSAGDSSNADPKPQHNKIGEDTALIEVKTEQK